MNSEAKGTRTQFRCVIRITPFVFRLHPTASHCVRLRPPTFLTVHRQAPRPLMCTDKRLNYFVHYGDSTLQGSVTGPLRRTDGEQDACDLTSKGAERC